MTIYARVSDPTTIANILADTWDANVGEPANPFRLLLEGAFSNQYDYRGMDVRLHFDRIDGSPTLEAGWTGEWNHDPDFALVGPDFFARTIPQSYVQVDTDADGIPDLEAPQAEVVAGPFFAGQFNVGDPSPDGSGLVYAGDEDDGAGGKRYSGTWIRPFDILRGGL